MKTLNILIQILIILGFGFMSGLVQAETGKSSKKVEHSKHQHKDKKHDHSKDKVSAKKVAKDKVLVKVKGMVCAFCAQGIEKNFKKREEVKETKVDLDKMEVLITLKKGKELSEETIKEVVTSAGFSYEGIIK